MGENKNSAKGTRLVNSGSTPSSAQGGACCLLHHQETGEKEAPFSPPNSMSAYLGQFSLKLSF